MKTRKKRLIKALHNWQFITGSPWVGFANFERLFVSYWFPIILKNTLTLSLLSLAITFPLPIIFALMVNELQNEKVKRTIQTVSYAPHFISTVVMCGMVILSGARKQNFTLWCVLQILIWEPLVSYWDIRMTG